MILNFLLLIIFTFFTFYIFSPSFKDRRYVALPSKPGYSYLMSKNMYFLIFIVCTAPFFLGAFSLIKYALYWGAIILLALKRQVYFKFESITISYLIFYLWLIVGCFYTDTINYDSVSLLIKYSLPILSLWLGYSSLENEFDLYHFSKAVTKVCVIYALFIGGFSATFMPWLYYKNYTVLDNMFLVYAGIAGYFTSLFSVPLAMHWMTGKNRYIIVAIWLLLSSVLDSVRTSIGGIVLGVCFFFFIKYKVKSIPYIIAAVFLFFAIILYVPSVNQKFFGERSGTITANDIINNNALGIENIQTSGRSYMWELALTKFFDPNPVIGSGLGSVTNFMKIRAEKEHTIALLHSDYVQILCDNGVVGLILFSLFAIVLIFKVIKYTWILKSNVWINISGAMALASFAGVAFTMGFDNVVSHSMTCMINPFIFIGFFLRFIDLSKEEAFNKIAL